MFLFSKSYCHAYLLLMAVLHWCAPSSNDSAPKWLLHVSWKPSAGWAFWSVVIGPGEARPLLLPSHSSFLSHWCRFTFPSEVCCLLPSGCRNKSTTNWLVHPCDLYWILLVVTSILLCLRERKWIFLILWLENWCLWARWKFVFRVDVHWTL